MRESIEVALDRNALRVKEGQTPNSTPLTVWEEQVQGMTSEQLANPKGFWQVRSVRHYLARWGGLPGQEVPVEATPRTGVAEGRTNGRV